MMRAILKEAGPALLRVRQLQERRGGTHERSVVLKPSREATMWDIMGRFVSTQR